MFVVLGLLFLVRERNCFGFVVLRFLFWFLVTIAGGWAKPKPLFFVSLFFFLAREFNCLKFWVSCSWDYCWRLSDLHWAKPKWAEAVVFCFSFLFHCRKKNCFMFWVSCSWSWKVNAWKRLTVFYLVFLLNLFNPSGL